MDGTWNVYFEDMPVGTCRIGREGLYYRFCCRCDKVPDGICRLVMQCGEKTVELGVLVPMSGGFGLDRKLPVKCVPTGELRFWVQTPVREVNRHFVQVRDGECFSELSRLTGAKFGKLNGEAGVFLD